MKTYDFTDPTQWQFTATVAHYLPTDDDDGPSIGEIILEEVAYLNDSGDADHWTATVAADAADPDSRYSERGTCDHCGAHFNYGAAYTSVITGEVAIVGHICATGRLNLTADEYAAKRLKEAVKRARSRHAADVAEAALLANRRESLQADHHIVRDIRARFRRYHSLSVRQWALVKKIAREQAERAAEKGEMTAPIPDALLAGRHTITGKILGIKWDDNGFYGPVCKMLVRDDRGFKVWGSKPSALDGAERGARVTFCAAIQASYDDPKFGFFKRPTKAEVTQCVV